MGISHQQSPNSLLITKLSFECFFNNWPIVVHTMGVMGTFLEQNGTCTYPPIKDCFNN